jgi:hypothetical protein
VPTVLADANYLAAVGLIVDIWGAILLANDLFKHHIREWIDNRERAFLEGNEEMCRSVVEKYEALPQHVYPPKRIHAFVTKAREHYAKRGEEFKAKIEVERREQKVQTMKNQWRGVVLLVVGFILQLIGTLAG